MLLQLPHDLLVGVHTRGDTRHILHQDAGAVGNAGDIGDRAVDRAGNAGDGTGNIIHRGLQAGGSVVECLHCAAYVVRILPVLLSGLYRPLQLGHNRLAQVAGQLPGALRKVIHRSGDHPADRLNAVGRLGAGVGQLTNLLGDDGKSGSRSSRPGGLNGSVDGDQVGGGGDIQDCLGQGADLVHILALFQWPGPEGP